MSGRVLWVVERHGGGEWVAATSLVFHSKMFANEGADEDHKEGGWPTRVVAYVPREKAVDTAAGRA